MNRIILMAAILAVSGTVFAADIPAELNRIGSAEIKTVTVAVPAAVPVAVQQKATASNVLQESGNIRACVRIYTPGFSGAKTVEGYCVGNLQILQINTYTPAEVISTIKKYEGQPALLLYTAQANAVGCDLITAMQHPIACAVKSPYEKIELRVNGTNILPLLSK